MQEKSPGSNQQNGCLMAGQVEDNSESYTPTAAGPNRQPDSLEHRGGAHVA